MDHLLSSESAAGRHFQVPPSSSLEKRKLQGSLGLSVFPLALIMERSTPRKGKGSQVRNCVVDGISTGDGNRFPSMLKASNHWTSNDLRRAELTVATTTGRRFNKLKLYPEQKGWRTHKSPFDRYVSDAEEPYKRPLVTGVD
jgi:hypothetical protein